MRIVEITACTIIISFGFLSTITLLWKQLKLVASWEIIYILWKQKDRNGQVESHLMWYSWTMLWDLVSAPLMAVVSHRDLSPAAEVDTRSSFRIVIRRDCPGPDPRDPISLSFIEVSSSLRLGCRTLFWRILKSLCLPPFHPQGLISQFCLLFLSSCRKQLEDWSQQLFGCDKDNLALKAEMRNFLLLRGFL